MSRIQGFSYVGAGAVWVPASFVFYPFFRKTASARSGGKSSSASASAAADSAIPPLRAGLQGEIEPALSIRPPLSLPGFSGVYIPVCREVCAAPFPPFIPAIASHACFGLPQLHDGSPDECRHVRYLLGFFAGCCRQCQCRRPLVPRRESSFVGLQRSGQRLLRALRPASASCLFCRPKKRQNIPSVQTISQKKQLFFHFFASNS